VQHIAALGITTTYEFGPGKVLSGLAKRIDKSVSCVSVNDVASVTAALAQE
jgi:[acyl-carrier-protein] S-malonyltransferase